MNEGSKFQRAEKARKVYVDTLIQRGVLLNPTNSRVIFRTQTGKKVGLPFSTERPSNGGWFMGLPDQHFDFVILLCQIDTSTFLDFVFPPEFVSDIWDSLSRQYQGSDCQVKFDVRRRIDAHELRMGKGRASELIQHFLSHTEIIV